MSPPPQNGVHLTTPTAFTQSPLSTPAAATSGTSTWISQASSANDSLTFAEPDLQRLNALHLSRSRSDDSNGLSSVQKGKRPARDVERSLTSPASTALPSATSSEGYSTFRSDRSDQLQSFGRGPALSSATNLTTIPSQPPSPTSTNTTADLIGFMAIDPTSQVELLDPVLCTDGLVHCRWSFIPLSDPQGLDYRGPPSYEAGKDSRKKSKLSCLSMAVKC